VLQFSSAVELFFDNTESQTQASIGYLHDARSGEVSFPISAGIPDTPSLRIRPTSMTEPFDICVTSDINALKGK